LFAMSLIVEYQKIPQRNNILALLCNTLGCWFYFPATTNMKIFGYYRFVGNSNSNLFLFSKKWPSFLINFLPHSRICLLGSKLSLTLGINYCSSTATNIKYAKASGVFALILSTSFYVKWALILLPSQKFKILDPTK
jgi:hypothetical protein